MRPSAKPSISSGKYLIQPSVAPERASFLQYNSVVRFRASDGGYLLIESDGCLRKVPKECESDPRTLVTLFPRDPVANIAKQPKRIRSGDCAFLVHSSSAALQTDAGIARADSDEMIEGPAHLVSEVSRHDTLASLAPPHVELSSSLQHSRHSIKTSHASLTKQSIRKKQLERAFTPETESMPTTVWCLSKVSTHTQSRGETSEALDHTTDSYFRHGEQCQLFQNHAVVCYELQQRTSELERSLRPSSSNVSLTAHSADPAAQSPETQASSTSLQSSSTFSESRPAAASSPARGASGGSHATFSHVWLQETAQFGCAFHPTRCQCCDRSESAVWDNTWRICDVSVRESTSSASRAATSTTTALVGTQRQRRSSVRAESGATGATSSSQEQYNDNSSEALPCGDASDSTAVCDGDEALPSALTRQTSVYDVATFAVRAEARQAGAARIIVRFFQRLYRHDVTQSRVQDFLRRRRRLTHTERHVNTDLSPTEQFTLLQCYNPQLYRGNGLYERGKGASPLHRTRRGIAFATFTDSADADRQRLATMKCDVAYLNRDWLRTERHTVVLRRSPLASDSDDMYTRRPLSSPITSERIVANRAREHAFLVQMKMAAHEPPTFHFGGARPRTAPLAALESKAGATAQSRR